MKKTIGAFVGAVTYVASFHQRDVLLLKLKRGHDSLWKKRIVRFAKRGDPRHTMIVTVELLIIRTTRPY